MSKVTGAAGLWKVSKNVTQKLGNVNRASESSKKCSNCGLRNFADQTRCARCASDLSQQLTEPNNRQSLDRSAQFGRSKVSVVLILAAVLLVGGAFLYFRQDSPGAAAAASKAAVPQPVTQEAEQPEQVIAQESPESREAAKNVLAELKSFQGATGRMSFEEYDEKLIRLKADLNNTLPSFVDHNPSDESFRQEVDAALRDYTAAGNFWKTTIRNSAVFTDADRTEKLNTDWTSAKTHLDNAERMLVR